MGTRDGTFVARALVLTFALQACGIVGPHAPIREEPATALRVIRATDLGPIGELASIEGRDGGISAAFGGRSVWLYGDTVFREQPSGAPAMISNSWAWSTDTTAEDGIQLNVPVTPAGNPRPLLEFTRLEQKFNEDHAGPHCRKAPCGVRWALWPSAIVADPERHRALVFYAKVLVKPGTLNLQPMGRSIAVWPESALAAVRPENDGPPTFDQSEAPWGSGAVVERGMLYVYAGVRGGCAVARVPLEKALDHSAYRYFDGHDWSDDSADATPVLRANDLLSVAYNEYVSGFLAVYVPPVTNQVMLRVAQRPEGPWSKPVPAFRTRSPAELWVYDAEAHPELQREQGRIQYVTYSVTTGPLRGQMRLVELELGGLEASR